LSTLFIRLTSKAVADNTDHWPALACPFALVSHGSAIERQGNASLSDLSDTITKSQRIVLLLAASDVTLLRVKVPPLSSAKLKAALPNLVENQLITDPADCVVVAGRLLDGLRTVAVVQRTWLDLLAKTLISLGARNIAAIPAQLCLAYQSGQTGQSNQPASVTAVINDRGDAGKNAEIDMTLRLSEQEGIGLAIAHEMDESVAHVAIQTLCAVVPEAQITLYVPQSSVRTYQEAVNDTVMLNKRISVSADNWSHWIAGANGMTLDLMAGLSNVAGPKLDWRPWRWPLTLVAVVLFINAAALNIDWWRMKSETTSLRTDMIQIYKSAYPKESVIIDPIAQMQQKIVVAKHNSGLPAPDDFTAIVAAFGEAWAIAVAAAGKATEIAALDFHEHSLYVRLKPGGESLTQQMKAALAKYQLALELAPAQSGDIVWKIRSEK